MNYLIVFITKNNMATTPNALDYLSKATNSPRVKINRPNLFDFSQKSTVSPTATSFISNISQAQPTIQPQVNQPILQNKLEQQPITQ
jgi:hypothetical protein